MGPALVSFSVGPLSTQRLPSLHRLGRAGVQKGSQLHLRNYLPREEKAALPLGVKSREGGAGSLQPCQLCLLGTGPGVCTGSHTHTHTMFQFILKSEEDSGIDWTCARSAGYLPIVNGAQGPTPLPQKIW